MRRVVLVTLALLTVSATANAAVIFTFDTDPFAGSTAPIMPGRQVVGGEPFITFDVTEDVFSFVAPPFDVGPDVLFANDIATNLPPTDVNVIVLQSLDNDADPGTPFLAGNAANLIAAQITAPGAGFFIYFNSNLNLPRLVYSTDLDDNQADLKILARLTNLSAQPGALAAFEADNFQIQQVPEPASVLLLSMAGSALGVRRLRRRKSRS